MAATKNWETAGRNRQRAAQDRPDRDKVMMGDNMIERIGKVTISRGSPETKTRGIKIKKIISQSDRVLEQGWTRCRCENWSTIPFDTFGISGYINFKKNWSPFGTGFYVVTDQHFRKLLIFNQFININFRTKRYDYQDQVHRFKEKLCLCFFLCHFTSI